MSVVRRTHGRVVWGRRVQVLASQIAARLPERARVLDVGCGDGAIAAAVSSLRPDVEFRGIDVLVRPETAIPVTAYDGTTIPFDDGSFDAVTIVDVLHHTDDAVVLREARRVTTEAVVIKDHLAEGFAARPTLRLMDWVGNAGIGVALPYNYWSEEQWSGALADVGLQIEEEVTDLGLYPPPASWLFDRRLHVVWRLAPTPNGPAGTG